MNLGCFLVSQYNPSDDAWKLIDSNNGKPVGDQWTTYRSWRESWILEFIEYQWRFQRYDFQNWANLLHGVPPWVLRSREASQLWHLTQNCPRLWNCIGVSTALLERTLMDFQAVRMYNWPIISCFFVVIIIFLSHNMISPDLTIGLLMQYWIMPRSVIFGDVGEEIIIVTKFFKMQIQQWLNKDGMISLAHIGNKANLNDLRAVAGLVTLNTKIEAKLAVVWPAWVGNVVDELDNMATLLCPSKLCCTIP